ncbi:hypothetical protein TUBRATIS_008130 [Tubulinosema ratisbonensis]|uniref:Uncharacterized protein n=1 Tax=Tubulinosema ratisbonensis TaxID=291195 RepID=A0A437ANS4_9MICR|nr:hypothetical protein TUBRATIS_008130 [Tubulinosema ratisbonensis]
MRKLYTILISLLSIAGILVLVYVIYIVIEKRKSKSGEESKQKKEGSKKNPTFKLPRGEKFDIPAEGSEFEKEPKEPREDIWVGFREPYCSLLEKGITGERWNKGFPRFRTEYGHSHPKTKEEEEEILREMSLNEERITEEERLLNEQRKIEESKINEIKRAFEREKETFKEENTVIKQKLELEAKRLKETNIKLEEEWKRLDTEKRSLENEKKIEEVMLVKKRNQLEEERRIVEEEIKIRDEKLSEMKDLINEIKRLEEEEEHEAEKKRLETIRNEERHYVYKTHEIPPKSLHTSPVFVRRQRLGTLLRSVGRDIPAQKEHSPMSSEVNELIRQNRMLEEQIEKGKIYSPLSEEPRSLYMPGRAEVPLRHSKERQMIKEGSLSTILEEESTKQEKESALQTEDPKISEKVSGEIPGVSKPEEPVSIVYESPIEFETKTVTETAPTLPSERTTSTTEKEPTQKPLTKKATVTSVD